MNDDNVNNSFSYYSGFISLATSFLSLAYMLGVMNTKLDDKLDREEVLLIFNELIQKERGLSDRTYYIRPEVSRDFVSKEAFETFLSNEEGQIKLIIIEEREGSNGTN